VEQFCQVRPAEFLEKIDKFLRQRLVGGGERRAVEEADKVGLGEVGVFELRGEEGPEDFAGGVGVRAEPER
jgi:hypothetical protein